MMGVRSESKNVRKTHHADIIAIEQSLRQLCFFNSLRGGFTATGSGQSQLGVNKITDYSVTSSSTISVKVEY